MDHLLFHVFLFNIKPYVFIQYGFMSLSIYMYRLFLYTRIEFNNTRETPTFGGISLAFWGSGAIGKPPPSVAVKVNKIRTPGAPHLGRRNQLPSAAIKKFGTPNGFENFTCVTGIPNMCLVLKLDIGKVVSIADKQTHPVPY